MDQARYWMLTNSRPTGLSSSSNLQGSTKPSYDDSWEEQAFAEDASGALGGCVWPPRSYSCSFCGREFASAQALGGHMNVHRRDRARLKQSPNSQDHDHSFVYNPNPNSDPSSKENFHEPSLVLPLCSTTKSWFSSFVLLENRLFASGKPVAEPTVNTSSSSVGLPACLNLIVKEEIGCKRKRSDHTVLLPFFVKPISNSIEFESRRHVFVRPVEVSDHDQLSPSSDDDIDLELRLGTRYKVV